MKKVLRPSLPIYIPQAEDQQLAWLTNYKVQLPLLGPGYGLTEAAIALALLAINGLIATLTMLKAIRDWLSLWVDCNEQQQYDKPNDASVVVKWPKMPEWMHLPEPIKVNAWQPILDTTKSFLAKSNLSEQDRRSLLLFPYEPTKRRPNSAEQFDYPLIKLSEVGGSVVIRTQRGRKYRGIMAKYVIDYSNDGRFTDLTTSVDKEILVPIQFPEGSSLMTWTIRAVYIQNGKELDKWCPPLSIVLRKEGPVMAAIVQEAPTSALESSMKHLATNGMEAAA